MTTNEAARIARKTPTTIRRWIATGRLTAGTSLPPGPPWKLVWDISEEALADAIANGRKPGRPYKKTVERCARCVGIGSVSDGGDWHRCPECEGEGFVKP